MAIPLLPSGISVKNIGASVFRGGGNAQNVQGASQEKQQFVEQTKQFVETQKQNQTVIANMQQQFENFQKQLNTLTVSINTIATLLQQDTINEQNLLKQQQEQENRYSLRRIRLGRESKLEERIESAVITPVQEAAQKVQGIFGRVGQALQTLFFGFLGIQALKAIKAYSEGDEKELNSIKDLVIKNVGYVIGAFVAIKGGFFLIKLALRKLIGGVIGLLFGGIKTVFKTAASGIGRILSAPFAGLGKSSSKASRSPAVAASPTTSTGKGTSAPASTTGKGSTPSAGKGASSPSGKSGGFMSNAKGFLKGLFGGAGRSTALTSTAFDLATGEDPTKAVAGGFGAGGAAAIASRLPLPPILKFPLTIGAGIFGQQKAKELVGGSEESGGGFDLSKMFGFGNNDKEENKNIDKNQSTAPVSTPTQPAVGTSSPQNNENKNQLKAEAPKIESSQISEPTNTMMPQSSELKISTEDEKLKSPTEESAPLIGTVPTESKESEGKLEEQSNIFNISKNISFDFISPSQEKIKNPETIQPIEEPPPNVIVTSPQQQPAQQAQMPATPTDVPLISSSNPDNFYVLYSKLNYNVVV